MPANTIIVLITGPSCVGKTTLAGSVSAHFSIPLFAKDRFKEMMYEVLRPSGEYADLELGVSRMLGRMSIRCLEIVLEETCANRLHAIFEANFESKLFSPVLARVRQHRNVRVVQINMCCSGQVLLERFVRREQTMRHPGHGGLRHLEILKPQLLRGYVEPLEMQPHDQLISIDTSDIEHIDFAPAYEAIARCLQEKRTDPNSEN